ncbi:MULTISPECIES: LytR/AlgR family response regulator transcription factor [Flavobacterium]|jgi:DNA-binding LytR/AlgR family response regulator|uniref:Sensory transduction protein LytR n=1 Tax=Flavobacterium anhuiense TaxID=459526 RepID=A0AAC9GIX2_9FLAO|nr:MULTISPECIES: LytTR family DNA-binding domain-containing protein [Flavobacterium]AOC95753.1 Sensory transduction protein LytR [Flavobacterium anhuiense]EJF99638.1 LytTR family two component transcriptional regulator [Flavobacterium sp. F52]URM36872.1 LytTR family DNA-binding domain-containing protein [Flavobacterium anhuiense]SCY68166.1 two component transcriptional regulator, LytTR family [Flavobacterium anhuiense]
MITLIIEDEKPAARLLQRKLEKLDVTVETMLHSVEESVQWFENNPHPDLIFLDIQLSDGLSFEIFEKIDIKSAIIFTTAYDEYALKAFKLNSIDYLLKPIDEDDLETAVSKFKSRLPKAATESSNLQLDFEQIRQMLSNPFEKTYKKRFTVKIGQHLKVITTEEIECFFSENKGTYIHTYDNRDYLIDSTLEILEQELDKKDFFRVSRKFIVPLKAIKEIQVYTNSRLKVILPSYKDDEVIVSREKVQDFKAWLG